MEDALHDGYEERMGRIAALLLPSEKTACRYRLLSWVLFPGLM
jgi:hypothetical protein